MALTLDFADKHVSAQRVLMRDCRPCSNPHWLMMTLAGQYLAAERPIDERRVNEN